MFARDPLLPESSDNFQDTDETVKDVRNYKIWRARNNAKREAYCK
jgi:hypothetical protein